MSNQTFTFPLYLNPTWDPVKPNVVLVATYYTTAAYTYSATIAGPGLPSPLVFPNNNSVVLKTDLPVSAVSPSMKYTVAITTNSPGLKIVPWSGQIGTKPDGTAMCFQASLFSNDSGSDFDYNDCVITLQLFDASTD